METIGKLEAANAREAAVIRSLKRAYAEQVHARLRSSSNGAARYFGPNGAYVVDLHGCSCPAGTAGQACKHLAGWADKTGQLDRLIPDFYSRAFATNETGEISEPATNETTVCPECHGDGYTRMYTGGHFSDWWACDCHACGATGRVPVHAA